MIYIVSTGPGDKECMTSEVIEALNNATMVVGYKRYIDLIKPMIKDKKVFFNGMKKEIDRCKKAIEFSLQGEVVALVSGGDAGIYGLSGLMQELILDNDEEIEYRVYPGITSAQAAASVLGAPIVHDSVYISLSDLLTDINLIKNRLNAAGLGDFVTCIYNPKSKGRPYYIEMARDILLVHKSPDTPVGIVKNARRDNQEVFITNLKEMCDYDIDMSTMIIVGNSNTIVRNGKMITPRGYKQNYNI